MPAPKTLEKQQTNIKERTRIQFEEPQRFKVILHNDDFTTMDFVVMILKTVFFKNQTEAEALMMDVHLKGMAVAGLYPHDIALSKVQKATRMAREANFPLRLTIEPEEK